MRILKVDPGKAPYEKEIENKLSAIQAEVGGGLFEAVYLGENIILCCNEEGKLIGMEPNRWVGNDIICGSFFLVGDNEDGNFVSLSNRQMQLCNDMFGEPQQFTGEEPELEPYAEIYPLGGM